MDDFLSTLDSYAEPQTFVSLPDGRRLNLHVTGEGARTVILAAGFAGGALDWVLVQPHVAKFARVVSFDHAGLCFSDEGPYPRTSAAIVADLRAALAIAHIQPPYLLVGHSAGGMHMRRFAGRYPAEVTGLVLIDSVTDDAVLRVGDFGHSGLRPTWRQLLALSEAGALTPDTPEYKLHVGLPQTGLTDRLNQCMHLMRTRPSYYRTLIAESEELTSLTTPLRPQESLGDLPLTVLSAGRAAEAPFLQQPGQAQAWREMQSALARLSSRSVQRDLDCGHDIPIARPSDVVAAIKAHAEP
jgi:pimeloyl-ACP methyl ester carboxylesterase